MFNSDGTIARKVWRNGFVIGLGIASVSAAAQSWWLILFGVTVMLYTGWYFVFGEDTK